MKTILLIDDEEAILSVFSMMLEHKGYRVIQATSGEAGLELARQHAPDLILTDLSMPGCGGQAVLTRVRQTPELAATPVVLMTGDEGSALSPANGERGADGILVKPISMDALVKCVEAQLG